MMTEIKFDLIFSWAGDNCERNEFFFDNRVFEIRISSMGSYDWILGLKLR